jgi:tetratricopeptide (TPR) repeat protein
MRVLSVEHHNLLLPSQSDTDNCEILELVTRAVTIYNREGHASREVERWLDEAIAVDPFNFLAYHYRGLMAVRRFFDDKERDDFEEACECLTRSIRLNPVWVESYKARARVYQQVGDYDNCMLDCHAVVTLRPHDHESYFLRGRCRFLFGDHVEARRDLDLVLKLEPSFVPATAIRGRVLQELGMLEDAMRDFTAAVGCDSGNNTYRVYRAFLCQQMGDYSSAVAEFTAVIDQDPDSDEARDAKLARGRAFFELENHTRALQDFNEISGWGQSHEYWVASWGRLTRLLGKAVMLSSSI